MPREKVYTYNVGAHGMRPPPFVKGDTGGLQIPVGASFSEGLHCIQDWDMRGVEKGSAEGQSPFARGIGGVPQISKSPKTGGYRGLKSVGRRLRDNEFDT